MSIFPVQQTNGDNSHCHVRLLGVLIFCCRQEKRRVQLSSLVCFTLASQLVPFFEFLFEWIASQQNITHGSSNIQIGAGCCYFQVTASLVFVECFFFRCVFLMRETILAQTLFRFSPGFFPRVFSWGLRGGFAPNDMGGVSQTRNAENVTSWS